MFAEFKVTSDNLESVLREFCDQPQAAVLSRAETRKLSTREARCECIREGAKLLKPCRPCLDLVTDVRRRGRIRTTESTYLRH